MLTIKRTLMSSVVAGALLSATACGGGTSQEAATAQVQDAAKREPVEITFYRPNVGMTEEQFMDLMGNAIKEKFPYVTPKLIPYVNKTKTEEVISSGADLDIVILSLGFYPQFQNLNLSADLTEYIKKTNYDTSRLETTNFDFIKQFGNGKIESLPIFTTAEVLMYNKDIFDKFGVPYPTENMTWDDLYELAKQVSRSDAGVQYYGFLTSVSHMLNTNQLSLPFVDAKTMQPSINTEKFKQLAENFARFYNIPGAELPKEKYGKEADLFTKDKTLAMYAYFNSTMVGAAKDMNIDAVPLPTFKEAPGVGSQMYSTYASVYSNSKHKDVAFDILAYLTSDEMQEKFAKDGLGMSIVKGAKPLESFGLNLPQLQGKNIKAFYPPKPAPISPRTIYDDLSSKYAVTALREVAQKVSDANTAFRKAEEQAAKEIQAAKQQ
ncbi:Bacterial extracellular solute-binding protein [Paenibacillus konkukensis]|uniref:Bacterial extracellular solute-binding protein n=1 Tax=Paenibacillus konkukensis TaxID=2020716 RepID=A0ABY4RFI8_9BACL|nr:extracellular solute-binding protein [Paenibacillus konkukensis]UQZ81331.1 Bacterial extracellular solute-binding protein [Paenibacillus konkukensis]